MRGAEPPDCSGHDASCPDFAVAATGLPANVTNVCVGGSGCPSYQATTYSFTATFTPTVTQQVSCVVTVTIDGMPTTFTLSGTGTEPTIRFGMSPATALDLGEVRVGDTSTAASVLVKNYGSGPQPMTVSSASFDAASITKGFAIASGTTTSHVVAANGGSDPYGVTCKPTASGPVTGTLTITTDDPATPTATLTVSCTGITSNLVFLPGSPAVLAGTQAQGATRVGEPVDITITLKNSGAAAMTIHDLTLAGGDLSFGSKPAAGATVASGGSTNVVLHYAAATAVDQGTLGTLTINYDNNLTRTINVLGGALMTSMAISPDGAVDLGPVCIGNTSSKSFFVLKNNPGTFKVTAVSQPDAPFSLTGMLPTSGALAVDNNAVSFAATVTPTAPMALHSSFAVTTDIPGAAPHTVMLSSIGLPAGIGATPAMVDLGTISVGATSIGQTVTVTNCNTGVMNLGATAIVGANKDDFAIVASPTTTAVPSGSSASYTVVTSPKHPGALAATMQIAYDGGMLAVPLAGTGTGEVPDTRVDSTYYSCSVGSAGHGGLRGTAGAWPIGAAILMLLRRRRKARVG